MMGYDDKLFIRPSKIWRRFYTYRVWLVVFGGIALVGIHIGYLLFGNNSVEVLLRLESQRKHLEQNAQMIEDENAKLQKQIFELRGLKP